MALTKAQTAPLTIKDALDLANGDGFVAAIVDATTRKSRGLFPFDKPVSRGPWEVTAVELTALGYWSRFAGNGAGWPAEQDLPGRLTQIQPTLAALGVAFKHDARRDTWIFAVASMRALGPRTPSLWWKRARKGPAMTSKPKRVWPRQTDRTPEQAEERRRKRREMYARNPGPQKAWSQAYRANKTTTTTERSAT